MHQQHVHDPRGCDCPLGSFRLVQRPLVAQHIGSQASQERAKRGTHELVGLRDQDALARQGERSW